MKKSDILFVVGILMLSLATLLTGCGGGGGDTSRSGGTDATLTASNAPQVGDAVTQAVKLVAPATLGQVKAGSVSSEKRAPLMAIFQNIAPAIGKRAASGKQSSSLYHEDCTGGGSIEVTSISDVDVHLNVTADVTVNECNIGTQTMNGVLKVTLPADQAGDPLHASEFTIKVSNFTYSDPSNSTSISLTDNFTIVATGFTYDGNNNLTGGSITIGGSVTGTIEGKDVNIMCDSLGFQFTSNTSGVTVSVSGRINASCLGGWVTLSTNQPVSLPAGASCPTGGEIVASSGGNSITVHIAADSKITVFFNGSLTNTYDNCTEVQGLCNG